MSRRKLIITGLCACSAAHADSTTSTTSITYEEGRCFFDSADSQAATADDVRDGLYRQTSGDSGRDELISSILFRIARSYALDQSELPTFRFIPVGVIGDGLATDEYVIDPGTKGLVALNLKLLQLPVADAVSLVGFETIAAHEFAHIFQLRNNTVNILRANGYSAKEIELHADYLAGWYFRQQGEVSNDVLEFILEILFTRGDNNSDVRLHHGTKTDRMNAVIKGYFSGNDTDMATGAAVNGMRYIQELAP